MTAQRSDAIPAFPGATLETGTGHHVRALQVDGEVDTGRLAAAVRTVAAATPFVRFAPDLHRHDLRALTPGDPADACVALLRAELEGPAEPGAPNRFHWVPLGGNRHVLGLVAPQEALDARSLYAALGAVLQAYFDRFRAAAYRDPAELAGFDPVGTPGGAEARRRWWSKEFPRFGYTDGGPRTAHGRVGTRRLRVDGRRWAALTGGSGPLGANGSLAVVGLLAWSLRVLGRPGSSGFCCAFDLRDYFELGHVIGPFTDRLAFRVDVEGLSSPAFSEVMRRTQAGFLDSVVHYLPYPRLLDHGLRTGALRTPHTAALWDVTVHFCRNPPRSARTRDEQAPAQGALSIGLFREADLLGAAGHAGTAPDDGVLLDVHIGELGDDIVIVLDHAGPDLTEDVMDHLLHLLDRSIEQVSTDQTAPLPDINHP
ncbi:hypothetical protein [Streptomyces pinistramenti]|uniref:hypothetical protein n=1 Tax=Streptomyces pinistramenti TaxID=2884812 RepID=UPI001D08431B|nr:hypothetical protein [Streptomyces pinistramenti]MCB5909700.1 hypothetical protein [Streptomyces pinistramenti]